MTKKIIPFSLLALIFILCGHAQADIKAYCANKWPDDYEMRAYCASEQKKANHKLFSIGEKFGLIDEEGYLSANTNGSDEEAIVSRCMGKWEIPEFQTYDYEMVVYCTENQLKAYYRVR